LEQDRIPTREPVGDRLDVVGDFNGRSPLFADLSRQPDADIRVAFACSSKPGCDQARLRFGEGRSVALGKGSRFEDEFRLEQAGLRFSHQIGCRE
jgi:hypothetical protein